MKVVCYERELSYFSYEILMLHYKGTLYSGCNEPELLNPFKSRAGHSFDPTSFDQP